MNIKVKLPQKLEKRWDRISAFLGDDIDTLVIEGLQYVWKRYGKDITACESGKRKLERKSSRMAKQLKSNQQTKRRPMCDSSKAFANGWESIVGSYTRTISTSGIVTLPKDWVISMRGDSGWLYADKSEHRICIVSNADANDLLKKEKDLQPVILGSRNRIRIEKELLNEAGLSQNVELKGLVRYIAIVDAK